MWRFLSSCACSSGSSPCLEVGAGILAVAVEEEVVELVLEVVVVGDVALRLADRIVLLDRPDPALHGVGPAHHRRRFECGDVAAQEIEQVVDVAAAFDGQRAVHVGLAQRQAGAHRHAHPRPPVMNAHRDGGAGAGALDAMRPAGLIDDGELAFAQQAAKDLS